VLDGSALWRREQLAQQERQEETPEERSRRIEYLAQLVRTGGYAVQSDRLAHALLEWDPRRTGAKQSAEVANRRRAYMRDYMRKRRALSIHAPTPSPSESFAAGSPLVT
jgi:hypothetical protein